MNEQPKNIIERLLSIDAELGTLICKTAVSVLDAPPAMRDGLWVIVSRLSGARKQIWTIPELNDLLNDWEG